MSSSLQREWEESKSALEPFVPMNEASGSLTTVIILGSRGYIPRRRYDTLAVVVFRESNPITEVTFGR